MSSITRPVWQLLAGLAWILVSLSVMGISINYGSWVGKICGAVGLLYGLYLLVQGAKSFGKQ